VPLLRNCRSLQSPEFFYLLKTNHSQLLGYSNQAASFLHNKLIFAITFTLNTIDVLAFCRGADSTKGRYATPLDPRSSYSRKAYCHRAGKTYRPERAPCPRWPEASSMTPLRFYFICPMTVSRSIRTKNKDVLHSGCKLRRPGSFSQVLLAYQPPNSRSHQDFSLAFLAGAFSPACPAQPCAGGSASSTAGTLILP